MLTKSSSDILGIYLDLDGPILNFLDRSYQAYKDALDADLGENPLSRRTYYQKKRNKTPLRDIYKFSKGNSNFNSFKQRYLRNIEHKRYLAYDRLHKNAKKFLKSNSYNRLILVTLRKNRKNLLEELRRLKLGIFFEKVLSEKAGPNPHHIKAKLILKDGLFDRERSIIIGDTEADILAGKLLGIKTVAVSCGIRSPIFLKKLKPDLIVTDISKIIISNGRIA